MSTTEPVVKGKFQKKVDGETASTPKKDPLLVLRVSRQKDKHKGLVIYFKSEQIEDFMRSISKAGVDGTTSSNPGWNKHVPYMLKESMIKEDDLLRDFNQWGKELRLDDGKRANMSFLRAKGLGKGVEFHLEGLFSKTSAESWVKSFKDQYVTFVKKYLVDFDVETVIEVTTKQRIN